MIVVLPKRFPEVDRDVRAEVYFVNWRNAVHSQSIVIHRFIWICFGKHRNFSGLSQNVQIYLGGYPRVISSRFSRSFGETINARKSLIIIMWRRHQTSEQLDRLFSFQPRSEGNTNGSTHAASTSFFQYFYVYMYICGEGSPGSLDLSVWGVRAESNLLSSWYR